MRFLALLLLLPALVLAQPVDPFAEVRYCGKPERSASGQIVRSQSVLRYFQRLYPCPSTGKTSGRWTRSSRRGSPARLPKIGRR